MTPDCFFFRRETTKKMATNARITAPATVTPTTGPVLLDFDDGLDFPELEFRGGVCELGTRCDDGGGGTPEEVDVGGLTSFNGVGVDGTDGVGVVIGVGGVWGILGNVGGGMATGGGDNETGGEMTVAGGVGNG